MIEWAALGMTNLERTMHVRMTGRRLESSLHTVGSEERTERDIYYHNGWSWLVSRLDWVHSGKVL